MTYDKNKRIDVIGELCNKYNEYHAQEISFAEVEILIKKAQELSAIMQLIGELLDIEGRL